MPHTSTLADRERIAQITYEHVAFANSHPEYVRKVADNLNLNVDAAVALAVADQVCEEFRLERIST